jgi:hypothetical protein
MIRIRRFSRRGVRVGHSSFTRCDDGRELDVCENPARRAFAASGSSSFFYASTYHYLDVPDGKRFVTQFVSMRAEVPSGRRLLRGQIVTAASGPYIGYDFVPRYVGRDASGRDVYVVSQPATLYSGPERFFALWGFLSGGSGGTFRTSVSGYLVDCDEDAPCD